MKEYPGDEDNPTLGIVQRTLSSMVFANKV